MLAQSIERLGGALTDSNIECVGGGGSATSQYSLALGYYISPLAGLLIRASCLGCGELTRTSAFSGLRRDEPALSPIGLRYATPRRGGGGNSRQMA